MIKIRTFYAFLFNLGLICNSPLWGSYLYDEKDLTSLRQHIQEQNPLFMPAFQSILEDADTALNSPPGSVMNKTSIPPSGSKHDYMSLGTYWWPNPDTSDGLPYIRKDGKINPATKGSAFDLGALNLMVQECTALCWAYYLTNKEVYAKNAVLKLQKWFLDKKTAMLPHLSYSQGIPGIVEGRSEGIIDCCYFPELFEAASLLKDSMYWSLKIEKGLENWACKYLEWLLTSPNGKKESRARNNHGTWFDYQVIYLALYTHQPWIAKKQLTENTLPKLTSQIEPDGAQPYELNRTRPFHYVNFNLLGLFYCAHLGHSVGVNLFETNTLKIALDWIIPYATGEKSWEHVDLEPVQTWRLAPVLIQGYRVYKDPYYLTLYNTIMQGQFSREKYRLYYSGEFIRFDKDR